MNNKKKKRDFEIFFLVALLQLVSGKSVEINTYARQSRNGQTEESQPPANENGRAMNGASFYPQNLLYSNNRPANVFYRPIGRPVQRRVDMEKFDLEKLPEYIDHAPAGYNIIKADPHDHHHDGAPKAPPAPPPAPPAPPAPRPPEMEKFDLKNLPESIDHAPAGYDIIKADPHDHHHHAPPPPPPPPPKKGLLKPIHRYKFFQVERQLWWAPLYFTIYFVFYCSMLVIRFLMRRGLQLPNKYKARDFGLGGFSEMTNAEMADKVDTMARYTMKLIDGYADKVKNANK